MVRGEITGPRGQHFLYLLLEYIGTIFISWYNTLQLPGRKTIMNWKNMKTFEFQNVTLFYLNIREFSTYDRLNINILFCLLILFLVTNYLIIIFFSLPPILIKFYIFSWQEQLSKVPNSITLPQDFLSPWPMTHNEAIEDTEEEKNEHSKGILKDRLFKAFFFHLLLVLVFDNIPWILFVLYFFYYCDQWSNKSK